MSKEIKLDKDLKKKLDVSSILSTSAFGACDRVSIPGLQRRRSGGSGGRFNQGIP